MARDVSVVRQFSIDLAVKEVDWDFVLVGGTDESEVEQCCAYHRTGPIRNGGKPFHVEWQIGATPMLVVGIELWVCGAAVAALDLPIKWKVNAGQQVQAELIVKGNASGSRGFWELALGPAPQPGNTGVTQPPGQSQ